MIITQCHYNITVVKHVVQRISFKVVWPEVGVGGA